MKKISKKELRLIKKYWIIELEDDIKLKYIELISSIFNLNKFIKDMITNDK